jgi:hypothetical protein
MFARLLFFWALFVIIAPSIWAAILRAIVTSFFAALLTAAFFFAACFMTNVIHGDRHYLPYILDNVRD